MPVLDLADFLDYTDGELYRCGPSDIGVGVLITLHNSLYDAYGRLYDAYGRTGCDRTGHDAIEQGSML